MKELGSEQLKQVSGGVILGLSDVNTYNLVLDQYEFFFLANYQTGDIYFFQGNGSVIFMNPLSDVSYPMSFPFTIDSDQLCEFSVPSKLF